MSSHLLPVKTGNEQFPVIYRNTGPLPGSGSRIVSGLTAVHNGTLYCFKQGNFNHYATSTQTGEAVLYTINLFTGEMKKYAQFAFNRLWYQYIGSILVDDNYIYLSSSCTTVSSWESYHSDRYPIMIIFKLKDENDSSLTLQRIGAYKYTLAVGSAYGRARWYDSTHICVTTENALLLFDIKTHVYQTIAHNLNWSIRDFAVGKELIVATRNSTSSPTFWGYRISDGTFFTGTAPSNGIACIDYYDGKFFFANANYLYIYDENTETFTTTKNIPWTTPHCVCVSDFAVYVISNSSSRGYIYDYKSDFAQTFIFPWTINTLVGDSDIYRGCVSENYWFLNHNTLMICDYSGYSKYNLGYIYKSFVIHCNETTMETFTYDPRFVSFDETSMYVHDGNIDYDFESTEQTNIKSAHISKSDYKFLNRIEFK